MVERCPDFSTQPGPENVIRTQVNTTISRKPDLPRDRTENNPAVCRILTNLTALLNQHTLCIMKIPSNADNISTESPYTRGDELFLNTSLLILYFFLVHVFLHADHFWMVPIFKYFYPEGGYFKMVHRFTIITCSRHTWLMSACVRYLNLNGGTRARIARVFSFFIGGTRPMRWDLFLVLKSRGVFYRCYVSFL